MKQGIPSVTIDRLSATSLLPHIKASPTVNIFYHGENHESDLARSKRCSDCMAQFLNLVKVDRPALLLGEKVATLSRSMVLYKEAHPW